MRTPSLIRASLATSWLLLAAAAAGCGSENKASAAPGGRGPAPVVVAPVIQRDVPVEIRSIATVEPYTTVTIRSRVAGQLQKVHIRPGQEVKSGDLLFEVDPRPFEAALHQAQATLERDKALASNARIDAERLAGLIKNSVATQEEADKARFAAAAADATVRADEAMVETVRLQLDYTKIRSPIDGRAGELLADLGNVVKVDDTPLLTINQIEPIYVMFNVPEQDLDRIRKYSGNVQPDVEVTVPPDTKPSETGKLTFIDNEVDRTTGTLRLRATFANQDHRLWPGQFVQANLKLTTDPGAIVIPSRAIQNGQNGTFVFTLNDDMTVAMKRVNVRRAMGEESVIDPVLSADERVVVDGHLRLTPGAKVQLSDRPTTAPATQESKPL
jgi:multidrug efflux system membrane fusion protein